jgi:hypothetical protein
MFSGLDYYEWGYSALWDMLFDGHKHMWVNVNRVHLAFNGTA